jgi:hypothetical protein
MPITKVTYSQTRQIQQFHPETVTLEYTLDSDEEPEVGRIYSWLKEQATTMLYGKRGEPQPRAETVRALPATDKQRGFMDHLVRELGWNTQQLVGFAEARRLDVPTLTATEASTLIDALKAELDGRIVVATKPAQSLDDLSF